jgi:hypothetical protein
MRSIRHDTPVFKISGSYFHEKPNLNVTSADAARTRGGAAQARVADVR